MAKRKEERRRDKHEAIPLHFTERHDALEVIEAIACDMIEMAQNRDDRRAGRRLLGAVDAVRAEIEGLWEDAAGESI